MNIIELMLEALKAAPEPFRAHYTSEKVWIEARDKQRKAIAAGEAELQREPVAWEWWSSKGEFQLTSHEPADFELPLKVTPLGTREEIK